MDRENTVEQEEKKEIKLSEADIEAIATFYNSREYEKTSKSIAKRNAKIKKGFGTLLSKSKALIFSGAGILSGKAAMLAAANVIGYGSPAVGAVMYAVGAAIMYGSGANAAHIVVSSVGKAVKDKAEKEEQLLLTDGSEHDEANVVKE